MVQLLDYSVYPDLDELPETLNSPEEKADYVARICGAWDFGIVPTDETFELFQEWEQVFEEFPLLSSPAYSAFRVWYGWTPLKGNKILSANYERLDKRKERLDTWIERAWIVRVKKMNRQPKPPDSLDPLAVKVLNRIQQFSESSAIVLGGHFALKHYLDYRSTHDIDAWWAMHTPPSKQSATLDKVKQVMQEIAEMNAVDFVERNSQYVYSAELQRDRKTFFSFQIAERQRQLEEPLNEPWFPVKIETLRDNVGEKMSALVNRGAPRDFVDIQAVIKNQLFTVIEVWNLWQQKNPQLDLNMAKKEVLRHLQSIELRRPLEDIPVEERVQAQRSRQWFREELLQIHPKRRSPRP